MKGKKIAGFVLYFLGIAMGIAKPPVERLACIRLPSGEVCKGINTPLLAIELGLVMLGSLLFGLSHNFRNTHELNGWLGVATGLGMGIIGGYAGIDSLLLLGALLATFGLILYKLGRGKHASS
ncbi:hypothetical protein [Thermococcus sp.]